MMNRMAAGEREARTLTYNIELSEITENYAALFEERRRDALFAFAFPQKDGSYILGRDHLGNVPLYFRLQNGVQVSFFLPELLSQDDTLNDLGLRTFIATGTAKTVPLFNEIMLAPPGVVHVSPDGTVKTLYEYRMTPRELPGWSFEDCCIEADRLLLQAAKRTVKEKTVGLYLSGGIDSALTGLYLARAGVAVNAYTAIPWGNESEEAHLAKLNGETIGVSSHELRPLETNKYEKYIEDSLLRYSNPCGTASQMAILCLLKETGVGTEQQVYFAQNCDTMNTSVPDQSLLFFLSFLPASLRGLLHKTLGARSIMDEFVSFRTTGLVRRYPPLTRYEHEGALAQLAIAGMRFGHTPVDGDIVILPGVKAEQRVSNLFYDMDVVEFSLGIPLIHRLAWSHESKFGLALGKRVYRELARRSLSPDIINRKKGLTIPVSRDLHSKSFFEALPKKFGSLALSLPSHRLAAHMLLRLGKAPHAPSALSQPNTPIKASVGILTCNSGRTLARALQSVHMFDDVIICDGGSTDDTLSIAQKFGARIVEQDATFKNSDGSIADFSGVRNGMLKEARHDWFLYIDSDEELSREAAEEVRSIVDTPLSDTAPLVYRLPRKTVIDGTVIDCATVYPNYQLRFFNRTGVAGFIKQVHERILPKEGVRIGTLTHPEYVPIEGREEFMAKQSRYLAIEVARRKNDTLSTWLSAVLFGSLKSSLSYLARHVRILLFCRGTFMPLWIENMHHWYNWKLITMTGAKYFGRAKKQDAE